MLLARAFVLQASPRMALAVMGLGFAVFFALVAVAAGGGLVDAPETVAGVAADPGWAAVGGDPAAAPGGGVWQFVAERAEGKVATLTPWPLGMDEYAVGSYAQAPPPPWTADLAPVGLPRFAPPDAVLLPPERFEAVAADAQRAVVGFFAGADRPVVPGATVVPWTGVGGFYVEGARDLRLGVASVVLGSAAVAGLLGASFMRLEMMARADELATLEALGGRRLVLRLMLARAGVLTVAALVFGCALAFGGLRVLDAAGVAGLHLATTGAAAALAAVAAVALATSWGAVFVWSRRALRARFGRGGLRVRPFRSPLRFYAVTPRVFPAAFAAAFVGTAVLGVLFQAVAVPQTVFGSSTEEHVLAGAGNPLRGEVDRFLALTAAGFEEVAAAVPYTYAPTVLGDRAVLVVGTSFADWVRWTRAHREEGEFPDARGEASVGSRLARIAALRIGDEIVVPAAYAPGVVRLTVTSVHATGGLEDDEILVDLDTGGMLAGIGPRHVSMLRYRLSDASGAWLPPGPAAGIVIQRVEVADAAVVPYGPVQVRVHAANYADVARERPIAVRLDGNLSVTDVLDLPGRSAEVRTYQAVAPGRAGFRIEVNPTVVVSTPPPELRVEAPAHVVPGQTFMVRVTDRAGPVAGAEVRLEGVPAATTGTTGNASLVVTRPALVTVSAQDGSRAGGAVVRVAPPEWEDEVHVVAERVFVGDAVVDADGRARVPVEVTLVNLGNVAGNATLPFVVDGQPPINRTIAVPAAARASVRETMTVGQGAHVVEVFGIEARFRVEAAAASVSGPRSVEEVLKAKAAEATARGGAQQDPVDAFLADVFADIRPATVAVVIATLLLGGSLVWVATLREVRERAPVVRTLRALGAQSWQVEGRAITDVLISFIPAFVAAALAAWVALEVARTFGFPAAFGHTLPSSGLLWTAARYTAALLVVAVLAVLRGVAAADAPRPGGSLR